MKILAIETSCDETAVSLIEAEGPLESPHFRVLGNAISSQVKAHTIFGGIVPNLAKREHAKNLVPLTLGVLRESGLAHESQNALEPFLLLELRKLLERELGLFEGVVKLIAALTRPEIDAIAVTAGPGLEPALWVGINFARALGRVWDLPIVPVNHMEGHIVSSLIKGRKTDAGAPAYAWASFEYPVIALLISGGHTELVLMTALGEYEVVGETRDDAVGEAFDKVARMLGLPYPGGPEISTHAEMARKEGRELSETHLPRPMIHSNDLNFSFSGLKTAVLYTLKKRRGEKLSEDYIKIMAKEFEDAVADVLIAKTKKAIEMYDAKTVVLGGGVSANTHIRRAFQTMMKRDFPQARLFIPDRSLSTDNALMIAIAGYLKLLREGEGIDPGEIHAEGKLSVQTR